MEEFERILNLPFPRMELFRDRLQWKYGFSLTAHGNTIKFLCSCKEDALKCFNNLRLCCNVATTHISRNYTLGKVITKTNFFKVHLAKNVNETERFTVKSIFKPRLFDNDQSLVCFYIKLDKHGERTYITKKTQKSRCYNII